MKADLEVLEPRWDGPCVVAATGASLTPEVAEACKGHHVIAVKQAYLRFPWADVLYALDPYWWHFYKGCPDFAGEKWTGYDGNLAGPHVLDIKSAAEYGIRQVLGKMERGFSTDPKFIHWGRNTGFQAVNMAIHWTRGPRKRIVMVGFDFNGKYFFGPHPKGKEYGGKWSSFIPDFEAAAKQLPKGVEILNASPKSALRCFPRKPLMEALNG